MNEIELRQKAIVEEFAACTGWEERYKKIIQLGKELPSLDESLQSEENKVQGCQSQVWVHAERSQEGKLVFKADSDALITRGLVALLVKVYSEASFADIITTSPSFIAEIGLAKNLSPSRTNGLMSMVKKMKYYAMAFQALG